MKPIVQEHFNAELGRAKIAIAQSDFPTAWVAHTISVTVSLRKVNTIASLALLAFNQ